MSSKRSGSSSNGTLSINTQSNSIVATTIVDDWFDSDRRSKNQQISYHLYFESVFSPESFAIFNVSDKHSLDSTLTLSKVKQFVNKLFTDFSFIPEDLILRIEKTLIKLHHGWCSHAMDMIECDLTLMHHEKSKTIPNDNIINDIGFAIETLMDTFEIVYRLTEIVLVIARARSKLEHTPSLGGNRACLNETLAFIKYVLVQPEVSKKMMSAANGLGLEMLTSESSQSQR